MLPKRKQNEEMCKAPTHYAAQESHVITGLPIGQNFKS